MHEPSEFYSNLDELTIRECHIEGCTLTILTGQLFCHKHNEMIPDALRMRMSHRTSKFYLSEDGEEAYREAIQHINKKEGR